MSPEKSYFPDGPLLHVAWGRNDVAVKRSGYEAPAGSKSGAKTQEAAQEPGRATRLYVVSRTRAATGITTARPETGTPPEAGVRGTETQTRRRKRSKLAVKETKRGAKVVEAVVASS